MHLKDIISDNNKISTASTSSTTLVAKIGLDVGDKILKLQNEASSELLFRKSPSIGLKLIVH